MHNSVEDLELQPPATLIRVCRVWRTIALSTPELWCTFNLMLDTIAPGVIVPDPNALEAYIHRWLGRAALRPLHLSFHREDADDPHAECIFPIPRLRDLIARCSSRLEYLELGLSQDELGELGLDMMEFPILQSATFEHVYGPDPDPDHPVNTFDNAPQLSSICLVGHAESSYYSLPWLQLTTFEGPISGLELFQVALNLTDATCAVDCLRHGPTARSPIQHNRLQSLALVCNHENPEDILEYLILPALRCLRISEAQDTTYPTLHSFLLRSSSPLITLSIRGDNDGFSDWQECLSSVAATLENLELDCPSAKVQNSILYLHYAAPFTRLQHSRISPPLPKLRNIIFSGLTSTNYGLLQRFLEDRSADSQLTKLESFTVIWGYKTSFLSVRTERSFASTMRRFVEAGTHIHIGTERKNYLLL
ncbi:F-box domain-containing protein [Mycena sanguinolenta]|uniref:F-box domain-containing protein n=1 Tax=Mycena sanguinolenta TaxID=230812 RepID=A0A8H6YBY2_9AGAR|nr:F-box domain-containing protein [Mycena sanguinolenta]